MPVKSIAIHVDVFLNHYPKCKEGLISNFYHFNAHKRFFVYIHISIHLLFIGIYQRTCIEPIGYAISIPKILPRNNRTC